MDAEEGDVRTVPERGELMTDAQTAALRERQRATIEAALAVERDPVKRAMWEAQRRKLAAWVAREGRDAV
jgi:hypothetical protein